MIFSTNNCLPFGAHVIVQKMNRKKKDEYSNKKLTSRECSLFVYFSFIASHLNSHAGGGEGVEMVPSLKKIVTAFIWILSKQSPPLLYLMGCIHLYFFSNTFFNATMD